ncbi:MAG: hypothetical protein IT483_13155 [Gammaproteobacteria bacterium]|nr:hypothetical protein [Gammaproteobacteria bacterium]
MPELDPSSVGALEAFRRQLEALQKSHAAVHMKYYDALLTNLSDSQDSLRALINVEDFSRLASEAAKAADAAALLLNDPTVTTATNKSSAAADKVYAVAQSAKSDAIGRKGDSAERLLKND